ncbi:UvrD-helicase domain-containing protein [Ruminococcus flavefaciens]|uniref:DNA 3'-5' helicase n=1 Tax=Ruminococcus flavefaciens TaxID=1265 RepID=A0A1K1MGL6_RUMFL|nr:UvrD-helicase domain-containing protein [Ruminococcus flavefaciens]SFW22225.1 PD-(D/E)XK nuclease superfamily protein [Ruminococcus flavefaciens]
MTDNDKLARERISTDIYENFFVEAGAGSGKTTQLVQRMTEMVKAGIDVSKISAITFTKAAAREFYERFQNQLIIESNNEELDNTERKRCDEALRNIDLCFMGTIDSFSHLILHEHPSEGRIPSDSEVRDDAEMAEIFKREYTAILHHEYGEELFEKYEQFSAVQDHPKLVFTEFISRIINARDAYFIYEHDDIADIDEYLSEEKQRLMQVIDSLMQRKDLWGQTKECLEKNELLEQEYSALKRTWNGNVGGIYYTLGKLDQFRLYAEPESIGILDTSLFAPYTSRGKIAYYTFEIKASDLYRELGEFQYSVTVDFLVSAARAIAERLRRNGELNFFDYKLYLRDMLKSDAEGDGKLIRHIYDRHSYFLIDEFQDTDPMQAEIFFYLTAENPVPNWRECVPRKGSLFIVGDPKQSIYRFRSADVAAFKEVRRLFENGVGEVVQLTRNFRSTVQLKEWFNTAFTKLLPEDTPHQSRFSLIPIEGSDDKSVFGGIWTYRVTIERNSIADDQKKVTQIIRRLVNDPNILMKSKNDTEPRRVRYNDFMVIVNSKEHILKFLREFESYDIPVMVEGKINFGDCPALCALIPIIEAVSSPYDRTAVYGALTSKVFGVTDSELITLRNRGVYPEINAVYNEAVSEFPDVKYALEKLNRLAVKARTMSAVTVFTTVFDELKVLEKTGTAYLEYLYYALELLRSAEEQGEVISVLDGAVFLRKLLDESTQERCISLQRNDNRVHIANLHKVKGLEAPIVILADPRVTAHAPEMRTEHTADGTKCYIFSLSVNRQKKAVTTKQQVAFEDEVLSYEAEKLRLLYVAATRARNALIIADAYTGSGDHAKNNPWEPFIHMADGDFFANLPAKETDEPAPKPVKNADGLYKEAEESSVFVQSNSPKPTYSIMRPSQIKLRSVIESEDDYEDNSDTDIRKKEIRTNAALLGTMVHKLMECLVSARKLPDADKLSAEIIGRYSAVDEYRDMLKNVYAHITEGGYEQNNGMCTDILSELRTADEVYCEVPFCYKVEEKDGTYTVWNGVIDLLYKKNGIWRIVDYKTNAEAEGLDYKYSDQLNAYKEAFFAMTGESADAFIYHIDI